MKKSILTMFLIVLISPLGSAMADGFGIALCSGGAAHSTYLWTQRFTPTEACEDACTAHLVGCKNTAKESTKCVLGLVDNFIRQVKEECDYQDDPSACKAEFAGHANYNRNSIADKKAVAEDYCDDQLPLCISTCDETGA